jgi:hypothetical protein
MKSDKELNNKVREINLSGYWVKSRLDPLYYADYIGKTGW